jgi:hypothetical protein
VDPSKGPMNPHQAAEIDAPNNTKGSDEWPGVIRKLLHLTHSGLRGRKLATQRLSDTCHRIDDMQHTKNGQVRHVAHIYFLRF